MRLLLAAEAGSQEVMACLCAHQADMSASALDGTTAVYAAAEKERAFLWPKNVVSG